MLYWLGRVSLIEVLMVVGGVYLLLLRPRRAAAAEPAATLTARLIDWCAVLALSGIAIGALLDSPIISFAGVALGAVGLGLTIRGIGIAVRRRIGRFFRQ